MKWNLWFLFCVVRAVWEVSECLNGGCITRLLLKFPDIAPKRDKYEI